MSKTVYEEYLELVSFNPDEIQKILPEWIKCCEILGFTEEDVRFAAHEWIPQTQQIEYMGVRKVLGAFTLECIEHSKMNEYKANGVKLVYGVLPALTTTYRAIKAAGGDKVFVSFPDLNLMIMAQCLFNKGGRFFELAESAGMTYGARHCALNKMRVGGRLSGLIPTPDVDWAWGTVCDEASKIDEYITNMYDKNWKTVTTRIPHNVCRGVNCYEDADRVRFLGKEFRRSMEEVEEIIGFKVSDKHVAAAFEENIRLRKLSAEITRKNMMADPQPLSGATVMLIGEPAGAFPMNSDYGLYEEGLQLLNQEVDQAIREGRGFAPKGSAKAAIYFDPWALPWIDKMFADNGVVLCCNMTTTMLPRNFEPSKYEDPYEKNAENWLKMVFTMGCHQETQDWIDKVNMVKPDAFIAGFLDYDRWIGALHKKMAKDVETATGVPSFYLEADFYDGRDYSPEALRTRIESICQIIRAKKRKAAAAAADK